MNAKIGMIGSGVVGYATGRMFVTQGYEVTFFDIFPITLDKIEKNGYKVAHSLKDMDSNIFFICVPTPDNNGEIDLSYIRDAITKLSEILKNREEYFMIVVKSSVIPGTTEKVVIPIVQEITGKTIGIDFDVCFNPEFLNEAHPFEDVMNPDRIVVGAINENSGTILESLYSKFKCPKIRTNIVTAEMAKYANNCFNATKISFFNEIHMMCKHINVDSVLIRKIVQLDRYYGIHPWEHGHKFGGKCLPKDLNAIICMFNEGHIHDPVLLKAVRIVNKEIEQEQK